MFKILLLNVY